MPPPSTHASIRAPTPRRQSATPDTARSYHRARPPDAPNTYRGTTRPEPRAPCSPPPKLPRRSRTQARPVPPSRPRPPRQPPSQNPDSPSADHRPRRNPQPRAPASAPPPSAASSGQTPHDRNQMRVSSILQIRTVVVDYLTTFMAVVYLM